MEEFRDSKEDELEEMGLAQGYFFNLPRLPFWPHTVSQLAIGLTVHFLVRDEYIELDKFIADSGDHHIILTGQPGIGLYSNFYNNETTIVIL